MATDSQSESQDTSSSSLIEDSLNVSFEDIEYTVRTGILSRGRKTLLRGLSGTFSAGELTVILGQSGAGKSTLMDILAGYTKPSGGKMLVNGRVREEKMFRRRSCYILQDDMVVSLLTIQESLVMAAELKLGNHISTEQKARRVEEIITSLGLGKVRNTRAGHLSGGQRKRLAIGLELVSDPPVMFLDEPTSGLDSSMTKQMVYLLHLLARQGRTIVATMHQPSAGILQLVDKLYTIVAGQCAYMGTVPKLFDYLEELNLTCPQYHNPVDILIEECVQNESKLVELIENGKCQSWIVGDSSKTDNQLNEISATTYFSINTVDEVFLTLLPTPTEDPTNKVLLKLKSTYSTSFWKQFTTLTKRAMLTHWRNQTYLMMILSIHCGIALLVGCLSYNTGQDAKYYRENYNCLFYGLMFLMFTSFNGVSITFPEQIPVVRREHFNRWYMTGAYYIATLVSSIPSQTICSVLYACITYWLTGQPHEFFRFVNYCWVMMLVSYVALCIGLLNGSMFNIMNGVIFGVFLIMPFFVFSGVLLQYSDAPAIIRWVFHISFLKHGLVALTLAVFGMGRTKLDCSDLICRYTYPKQVLVEREMVGEKYYLAILALMVIATFVNICTYLILKIRLRGKW